MQYRLMTWTSGTKGVREQRRGTWSLADLDTWRRAGNNHTGQHNTGGSSPVWDGLNDNLVLKLGGLSHFPWSGVWLEIYHQHLFPSFSDGARWRQSSPKLRSGRAAAWRAPTAHTLISALTLTRSSVKLDSQRVWRPQNLSLSDLAEIFHHQMEKLIF